MGQEKNQFRLDVRIVNQSPMKINVIDSVTAGIDPRNDLVLIGNKIKKKHFVFEVKGENLALHYYGYDHQTFLNSLPLENDRTYLLDVGDKLELTGVKITILQEMVTIHETQKVKAVMFNSLDELVPESIEEAKIVYADNPTGSMRRQIHVAPQYFATPILPSAMSLWPIKLYAFVFDLFITYLFLIIAFPLLLIDEYANRFFNYASSLISSRGDHSFLKFFIAWYIFNFIQTLIFGGTLGQFLLGLNQVSTETFSNLIMIRVKTFFYSLLGIPPQNSYRETFFFKAMRKMGAILVMIFILISPFLLPLPFNTPITLMASSSQHKKELKTRTILAYSKELGMALSTELPYRYYLLPNLTDENKKRSFQFIDLKTSESMIVRQSAEIKYSDIESKLTYGNPMYGLLHHTAFKDLPLKKKKELIANSLLLSPLHVAESTVSFGPFFGSAILTKDFLLDSISANDLVLKTYLPEVPVMFISSSTHDYFYLFEADHLSRFSIEAKNKGNLLEVFEEKIFSQLTVENDDYPVLHHKGISIFSAQEAFLHGEERTFLTYYTNEVNSLNNVKITQDEVDLTETAKLALSRNIDSVLKFIADPSVAKSFNDIKNKLAPMEKPGEKR
jgi:hypothetical protein